MLLILQAAPYSAILSSISRESMMPLPTQDSAGPDENHPSVQWQYGYKRILKGTTSSIPVICSYLHVNKSGVTVPVARSDTMSKLSPARLLADHGHLTRGCGIPLQTALLLPLDQPSLKLTIQPLTFALNRESIRLDCHLAGPCLCGILASIFVNPTCYQTTTYAL